MHKSVMPANWPGFPNDLKGAANPSLRPHSLTTPFLLAVLAIAGLVPAGWAQETLVPMNSTWRFTRGTNEVSSPVSAWRGLSFNDTGARWATGPSPFHYGDGLTTGTPLSDMRYNYTCAYFRKTFIVANVEELDSLILDIDYDDGFVAWVNGTEIARDRVQNTFYTNTATSGHEAGPIASFVKLAPTFVQAGTNVLTIQGFNTPINSSDFRMNAALRATYREKVPPEISSISPTPGASVGALSTIEVTFTEAVYGVDAADLLLNELPATGLVGTPGTNRWVFTFAQPVSGLVQVAWREGHGIADASGNPLDSEAGSASWSYQLADTTGPKVATLAPIAGAQVSRLTEIQVMFDEPVAGVTAGDLLINQTPATGVFGSESGPYVFTFPQPVAGLVSFSWRAGHSIRDLASAANAFSGSPWTVNLNPAISSSDVVISEFLAENTVNNHPLDVDENSELQDWIEIQNRGTTVVDLNGWSLTDDRDVPFKWVFPSVLLSPGQYLLVYASEKDRRSTSGSSRLHTNFKLNPFGEYLALMNPEFPPKATTEFTDSYPEQRRDYSFGRDAGNNWRYYANPTPNAQNGASTMTAIAATPHFTVTRGFFNAPFNLSLTTTQPGGAIYYTLDGSEPSQANGTLYAGAIRISKTTCVRACTLAPDTLPSRAVTHTYLYLDEVLYQPANPAGFPSIWGQHNAFPDGNVPADYEMDWDPIRVDPNDPFSSVDPQKLERFKQGMRELPSVSVVMNVNDMFGEGNSLHWRSTQKTPLIEKPCSIEMILPDGSTAFAVTAGIRMHGNASREPNKNPKHGFKLKFKGDFGEDSLNYRLFEDSAAEDYDDLLLRADFNSSWRHWSDSPSQGLGALQRTRATRTRYAWGQETMRDLGHVSPHNRFCHLFINGLYWGTYDFSEQPTEKFAENHVSSAGGHDIYEQGALREGSSVFYNTMLGISNLESPASYELMKQHLDVTQHIDYMLMHFFIGHQDWGNVKNWYAIRPRAPAPLGRFRYVPWDQECILLNENINEVADPDVPSGLHTKLDDSPEYRLEFADRVHKHMIAPGGALTSAANIGRWQKWQALLDKPIVAESMRWGDYRRDVHRWQEGTFQLYTREQHWLVENDRMVNSYFANRNQTVLAQLRSAGLYPSLNAPEFREGSTSGTILASKSVPAGYMIAMKATGGTVYYTTNGTDPRISYTAEVAPGALTYGAPLVLSHSVTLKARVFDGSNWSALNEATFSVSQLGVTLRFSEIMYNPLGGDAYEFIEVQNFGGTAVDLSGFSLRGCDYIFPPGTILAPGTVYLVASSDNPNAFAARYPGVFVNGYFDGSLANGGERLAIVDRAGEPVISVYYDDEAGWPLAADGRGASLENISGSADLQSPANWFASPIIHGTPGFPPTFTAPSGGVLLNELMALNAGSVTNGATYPDWVELHNTTASDIDLEHWSLTDDSNPRKFVFPAGTTLVAGGYLVVWCDSASAAGLHAGFSLAGEGETLTLFNAATNRVDAITYGIQLPDYSVGRVGDSWELNQPTPGTANVAAATAPLADLVLNEWLTASGAGSSDWIELYNRSSTAPAALQGLYIGTSNSVQQVRSLSFVAPRGFIQLSADNDPGPDHIDLNLPAEAGALRLYSEGAVLTDSVTYGLQQTGVSQGRLPDGGTSIQSFPGTTSPGAANYVSTYSGPVLKELLARNSRASLSPWGSYCDWIELHNPGAASVSLTGMGLADSFDAGARWIFPAGWSIPAGGYVVVWCDAASPGLEPYLNAGFNLSGEYGQVVLFNGEGQPVDSVNYGHQVIDRSLGRAGTEWRLLASPTPGQPNSGESALGNAANLRLNEWMAGPTGWIEVFNPADAPVALGGLHLTDDPSVSGITRFRIAPLSYIEAGGWVVWQADGMPEQGVNHVSFTVSPEGETLRLYDSNLTLVDSQDFGVQFAGVSSGRLPDGSGPVVQFASSPSPGEGNFLLLTNVVVNEVLAHSDTPFEDAIELHNTSDQPVNLGGWFLSDTPGDLKRYRIPDNTVIQPRGYLVFYQHQFGGTDGEEDLPPLFSLNSARGDAVYLSQADAQSNLTGRRTAVKFGATANGQSMGRYVTSAGVDFAPLRAPTFGADSPETVEEFRTGAGATNALPQVGPVVISEIMYHSGNNSEIEYVELHNTGPGTALLYDPAHPTNRWRLAGGISFQFAAPASIPAGGVLVVVPFDPLIDSGMKAEFQALYGTGIAMTGPYSGKLDNAGETVDLLRPDEPQPVSALDAGFVPYLLVERVSYEQSSPWPPSADGLGDSLHRVSLTGYANDPVNWAAATPTPGSVPGAVVVDSDGDGLPDAWEDAFGTLKNTPDAAADPDGDWMTNMQEYLAGTHPMDDNSHLTLTISHAAGSALLQFNAASNRTYSILFKDALESSAWVKLRDLEARSTNWQAEASEVGTSTNRFYRLVTPQLP